MMRIINANDIWYKVIWVGRGNEFQQQRKDWSVLHTKLSYVIRGFGNSTRVLWTKSSKLIMLEPSEIESQDPPKTLWSETWEEKKILFSSLSLSVCYFACHITLGKPANKFVLSKGYVKL